MITQTYLYMVTSKQYGYYTDNAWRFTYVQF